MYQSRVENPPSVDVNLSLKYFIFKEIKGIIKSNVKLDIFLDKIEANNYIEFDMHQLMCNIYVCCIVPWML